MNIKLNFFEIFSLSTAKLPYYTRYTNQLRTYSEKTLFPLHQTFSICQIISSIRTKSISIIDALKPKNRLKNFVFSGDNMVSISSVGIWTGHVQGRPSLGQSG